MCRVVKDHQERCDPPGAIEKCRCLFVHSELVLTFCLRCSRARVRIALAFVKHRSVSPELTVCDSRGKSQMILPRLSVMNASLCMSFAASVVSNRGQRRNVPKQRLSALIT